MREAVSQQVAVYETYQELAGTILQDEIAGLGAVVESRRLEFLTSRECARRAMAELGVPASPIPKGPTGAPVWPRGVIGSSTHCQGYRAAAVARSSDIASMGIDAEPNQPLPAGVLNLISTPAEQRHLERIRWEHSGTAVDRLLFCIKESIYKTWSPLEHVWLDFLQADVQIRPEGSFTAEIDCSESTSNFPQVVDGRWKRTADRILTCLILKR